jgi:VRR-NUC domain.
MISDETFRIELNEALIKRKMLKKDRNAYIDNAMQTVKDRDYFLDNECKDTADYLRDKEIENHINSEHYEQVEIVNWFRHTYPDILIYAVPNGGNRSASEANALVLEGVVAGIPDLHVPEWDLFIEMKRTKGGIVSDEQWVIMKKLTMAGKRCLVGRGFEDAKAQIEQFYFENN